MKLFVAISLNVTLAVLFWRWILTQLREPQLGRWLLPVLALKLLAWVVACWKPSTDAQYMHQFSTTINLQLWEKPGTWLDAMLGNEFHYNKDLYLIYHGYSNTFFTAKILSVLNLASRSSSWWNGLYLSLFCFVACWTLVRTLAHAFPNTPRGAALLGFLVWPTVVYWSAGVTKESLVLGSAAGLVAVLVGWLYGKKPFSIASVSIFVLLGLLHFKMRYFFAALLFSGLGGLTIVHMLQQLGVARQRWVMVAVFFATISAGAWVGSETVLVFRPNRITLQLLRNYNELSKQSVGRPRIVFKDFSPNIESVVQNAPQAVWEVVSRPWFWEGSLRYKALGIENMLLLGVLATALLALLRGRGGELPFALVVATLFYCIALAALIGLSTPNLGTMNRYRVALLPFVLWLALQNGYAARVLRRFGL